MTQVRLHEIAKALGMSSKVLMADLAKEGHEFKTHMATVDSKVFSLIEKKFPDLKAKIAAAEAAAAAEPKAEKKPAAKKSSKLITSKSKKGSGKASDDSPEDSAETPSVELVQRDEGQSGTVTLEQRVVKDGIIRRRRVEAPTAPAPAPVAPTVKTEEVPEAPKPAPSDAAQQAPRAPRVLTSNTPVIRRVAAPVAAPAPTPAPKPVTETPAPAATPVAEPVVTPAPTPAPAAPTKPATQMTEAVPAPVRTQRSTAAFVVPSSGRNLSAPSRLKVIETPPMPPGGYAPPKPRPAAPTTPAGARPASGPARSGVRPGETPAPTEEASEEAKRAAAKKKTAGKGTEDPDRLTKKDLLGMVEEVEITRHLGRRSKRPAQRIEKKATQITTPGVQKRKIRIHDEITVADLADQMGIKGAELVRKLISMGQMVSLSNLLDTDTAALIASEYKYEIINVAETAQTVLEAQTEEETGEMASRPPIVTIMGHVDHGKTSLLDYIRRARVAAGEAGGITQHIGAYQIQHNGKTITFLDTPGHAAFTAMRARGASVTDIVVLVVAADEGVKPQTLEALAHAQAAKVPIIVAVNKIDKPEAKPEVPIQELSGKGLVPEDWGGDTIYVKLSAKTGEGVDQLIEMLLLQAEVLDLKAVIDKSARGIVIESRLDKGKGPVATVMVQTGTLKQGDPIVSGSSFGKVRAMFDDRGQQIKQAGPSTPVEILGFDVVPEVGDTVSSVTEDAVARRASELATQAKRKIESLKNSRMSLEDMYKKMQAGDVSELRVVLKGDVQGSVEAIADSLEKIKHDKVRVNIIYKAVGGISESDVDLAAASGAILFGFNVRPTNQAKAQAARDGVQIKSYEVIYELIDEVKLAMQGLLAPIIKEHVVGQAEVREVFNVTKVGPIAGCYVKSGKILRNANVRVIRNSVVIYTAKMGSLRRFKDDAKEVAEGMECGIRVENYTDLKAGDILECFETSEVQQAVG